MKLLGDVSEGGHDVANSCWPWQMQLKRVTCVSVDVGTYDANELKQRDACHPESSTWYHMTFLAVVTAYHSTL
jgi:hypothetical protein